MWIWTVVITVFSLTQNTLIEHTYVKAARRLMYFYGRLLIFISGVINFEVWYNNNSRGVPYVWTAVYTRIRLADLRASSSNQCPRGISDGFLKRNFEWVSIWLMYHAVIICVRCISLWRLSDEDKQEVHYSSYLQVLKVTHCVKILYACMYVCWTTAVRQDIE